MFRKCPLSVIYDFKVGTIGCMKWSTNCEILSVGHSLADMIGLPGGVTYLCVFSVTDRSLPS